MNNQKPKICNIQKSTNKITKNQQTNKIQNLENFKNKLIYYYNFKKSRKIIE